MSAVYKHLRRVRNTKPRTYYAFGASALVIAGALTVGASAADQPADAQGRVSDVAQIVKPAAFTKPQFIAPPPAPAPALAPSAPQAAPASPKVEPVVASAQRVSLPALPALPSIPLPPPPAWAYPDNLDGWIHHALDIMHTHGIPGSYDAIYRNVMRESTGNPHAINLYDSNAAAGMPSKGLLQIIDPTFANYHVAGTASNIWDPVANIVAACNYAASRYGSMDNVSSAY